MLMIDRRKFIALALSGVFVPEYLLDPIKGKSMVSVPTLPKIYGTMHYAEDVQSLFNKSLGEFAIVFMKDQDYILPKVFPRIDKSDLPSLVWLG